jgi:predicted nucleic acid-binding Zn finger protein
MKFKSDTEEKYYEITWGLDDRHWEKWHCSCPDFEHRGPKDCKHIRRLLKSLNELEYSDTLE